LTVSLTREKTQILCNDADAHRKQRESLPSKKKVKILKTDADAHKKKRESLSPEDKDLFERIILLHNTNIASHSLLIRKLKLIQQMPLNTKEKTQESLSFQQNGQTKSIDAVVHKRKYELLPPEKKQDSWKLSLNNIMNI
jgi:hypothetical protein